MCFCYCTAARVVGGMKWMKRIVTTVEQRDRLHALPPPLPLPLQASRWRESAAKVMKRQSHSPHVSQRVVQAS